MSLTPPVVEGADHEAHVRANGGFRATWLYVRSWIVEVCECGKVLRIWCEHQRGVWPNNRSVCEWVDDDHLICTECGLDCT